MTQAPSQTLKQRVRKWSSRTHYTLNRQYLPLKRVKIYLPLQLIDVSERINHLNLFHKLR